MTDDPEYLALLETVRANPDDDAPRLILSDWLEDNGEDERSRFIRWQISGEISDAEAEYREGEPYGNPDEINVIAFDAMRRMRAGWVKLFPEFNGSARVVMSRGFISEVRLTCEQFCGGPCQRCDGQGRFAVTDENDETEWHKCMKCDGTGHIEGVARELFQAHPITKVVLVDKKPSDIEGIKYGWFINDLVFIQNRPDVLSSKFQKFYGTSFATEADANAALSAACVARGRRLAGLPALEEVGK